jgi:hypothetical protein
LVEPGLKTKWASFAFSKVILNDDRSMSASSRSMSASSTETVEDFVADDWSTGKRADNVA